MQLLTALVASAATVSSVVADSLSENPPVADADLTSHGSYWLWAAFAVLLASLIGMFSWSFMVPPGHRAFHWIGIAILLTATISYFTLASDLGATPIYVEFVRFGSLYNGPRNPYTRSIWYVRYIDWVITTPLLLLELLLATGMPLSGLFGVIFMDEVMIIAGLVGALVRSSYKWGYFTGSCIALFYITWVLLFPARANARAISPQVHKAYIMSAGLLCVLWILYPICWALADGANVISTDSEMVFYGVLDILAKPVFLFYHLFSLRKIPYETFQLQSGHFSAYASVPGNALSSEKRTGSPANATSGFTNDTVSTARPLDTTAANLPVAAAPMYPRGTGDGNMHVLHTSEGNMRVNHTGDGNMYANRTGDGNVHTNRTGDSNLHANRAGDGFMHVRRTDDVAV